MAEIAYHENDNVLELNGLVDLDDAYINNASVTLEDLYDNSTDVSVTGIVFPASFTYVTASSGVYRYTIQDTIDLEVGKNYTAIVKAVGAGLQAVWDVIFLVRRRTHNG